MKYTNTTIMEIAHSRGSVAKTKTGAWKYLLARLPKPAEKQLSKKRQHQQWLDDRRDRTGDGRAKILGYDLDDPHTPGRILNLAWEDHRRWLADCALSVHKDGYGMLSIGSSMEITARPRPELAGYRAAINLISSAATQGAIPQAYDTIDFDWKGRSAGEALHHELYDFVRDAALICIRRTSGSKYGVKTLSKTYKLILRADSKILVVPLSAPVAKFAKASQGWGKTIERILDDATKYAKNIAGIRTLQKIAPDLAIGTLAISAYTGRRMIQGNLKNLI